MACRPATWRWLRTMLGVASGLRRGAYRGVVASRHDEAIEYWERSAALDGSLATVWRNLGIAYFNVHEGATQAKDAFENAWRCDPTDARILYERDQLWKERVCQ